MQVSRRIGAALFCLASCRSAWPQTVDVSLRVDIVRRDVHDTVGAHRSRRGAVAEDGSGAVVWLTRTGEALGTPSRPPGGYVLTQKNREFTPHLLVVPTGSSVEFPNLDPFFHNVFSLFNGKRFDLGLYETNSHRSVRFDREGVSYIFCNIHPEMGAVIVAVSTPYYGVSSSDGTVTIRNVPAGAYRMSLWAENVAAGSLAAAERTLEVGAGHAQLGKIRLEASGDVMKMHQNKFGESYAAEHKDPY